MFWEPEIVQWLWGWRRETTWAEPGRQNDSPWRLAGLGEWEEGSRFQSDWGWGWQHKQKEEAQKAKQTGVGWWMVHSVLCVWNLGCWWIACFTPVLSALHHSWHHHSRSPLCFLFIHQTFGCLLQSSWMKPSRGPCLSIRISDVLSVPLNISWVQAPHTHEYTRYMWGEHPEVIKDIITTVVHVCVNVDCRQST